MLLTVSGSVKEGRNEGRKIASLSCFLFQI